MDATSKGHLLDRLTSVQAYSIELRDLAERVLRDYDAAPAHWCSRCGEEPPNVIRVDALQEAIEALRKVVGSG